MQIQIAVCDDRQEDISALLKALYAYDDTFHITEYTNGEFLIADYLEREILYDILFLDIYMPGLNGIEIAKRIREVMKDAIIIFVSSSKEHYPEAFDVFAFNYIIKPVMQEKLNLLMNQALLTRNRERGQQIQFCYKSINYRILCKDILYIESRDKTVLFHMADKTTLQCYSKLDQIVKQLPEDSFIRCHQSFIVNIHHITEMAENYFCMGTLRINISKKYQKAGKGKYFEYLFKHMSAGERRYSLG